MDENRPLMPVVRRDSKQRKLLLALLIMVLMAGAGAAVWFWQQRRIDDLIEQIPPAGQLAETNAAALIDPTDTANWSEVLMGPTTVGSNESGQLAGVSFRLPVGWTVLHCGNVSALAAYVSPTTDTQAHCNSEGSSPIVIVVQLGDIRDGYDYSDTAIYSDHETETVTISDQPFTRATAIFANPIEFMPAAGSTIVSYVAFIDGVSYAASYVHNVSDQADLTADFERLVTRTLAITTP